MKPRRIAISAGHSNIAGADRGAVGNGLIEGEETVKIRNRIKQILNCWEIPVSVEPESSATAQTVALFKKYFSGPDIVVDIHINAAANPKATGAEVIVPEKPSLFEMRLAMEMSQAISDALQIRNRGVKGENLTPRKKLLWFTIPAEMILIECFFISNKNDVDQYKKNEAELAAAIADVLATHRLK